MIFVVAVVVVVVVVVMHVQAKIASIYGFRMNNEKQFCFQNRQVLSVLPIEKII
jgi:hypothetical protein